MEIIEGMEIVVGELIRRYEMGMVEWIVGDLKNRFLLLDWLGELFLNGLWMDWVFGFEGVEMENRCVMEFDWGVGKGCGVWLFDIGFGKIIGV